MFFFVYFYIAILTRLIHNGNSPTIELMRNIDLLQQTWLSLSDLSTPPRLKLFDKQISSSMRRAIPLHLMDPHQNSTRFHKKILVSSLAPDVGDFIIKHFGKRTYKLHKTIFYGGKRLSSDSIDVLKRTHDGCLMYSRDNAPAIGFLETTISFENCIEPVLVIRPVVLASAADLMSVNDRLYRCTNVLYGSCNRTTLETTSLKYFIQKLAFRPGTDIKFPAVSNSMFFFQYPNLSGST